LRILVTLNALVGVVVPIFAGIAAAVPYAGYAALAKKPRNTL
jgi:hypothetical protein